MTSQHSLNNELNLTENRTPLMNLEHVSKSFVMRGYTVKALSDVSLEIWPQDIITISGPSGSGKSTLLNILGLLSEPNLGRSEFLGKDTSEMTDDQKTDLRRHNIGFVFQMHRLFPNLTAIENLAIPLLPYINTLNFDLIERARRLLNEVGLDADKDRRAFEMSGGEQQRVAIARALMNDPRVILADEPTGNLDETTSDSIIELIRHIHQSMNTGVVLVTHNLKYLPVGNKTYYLRNGILSN
ncbi:MAG TPA: ABC transporter ATP-binding protein [Anaerolineaceae bacterium]|nr:ABC transporter ATP-binding protein [Anaerolineaceae bacterium]